MCVQVLESFLFSFFYICSKGFFHYISYLCELFYEFRCKVRDHSKHVLINENLSIAARSCTYSYCRNINAFRNNFR